MDLLLPQPIVSKKLSLHIWVAAKDTFLENKMIDVSLMLNLNGTKKAIIILDEGTKILKSLLVGIVCNTIPVWFCPTTKQVSHNCVNNFLWF